MKIVIIGGGITGLYIGYMLNKYGIDFNIYEKTNHIGGKMYKHKNQIYPHQKKIISLLNDLDINYKYNDVIRHKQFDNKLFDKIRYIYSKDKQVDISVNKFLLENLTESEYDIFITFIRPLKLDEMEVSYYMAYQHDNIIETNQSKKVINIDNELISKLAGQIRNNIILNSNVQQITYMPITNNYMVTINDKFTSVDKIILTTVKDIQLIINKKIQSQLTKFQSYNWLKIDYAENNNIKPILKYSNSYLIIKQRLKTNFYLDYSLILAINYINSIEGSCIIGKKTVDIILSNIYSKGSGYLYDIE